MASEALAAEVLAAAVPVAAGNQRTRQRAQSSDGTDLQSVPNSHESELVKHGLQIRASEGRKLIGVR